MDKFRLKMIKNSMALKIIYDDTFKCLMALYH